MPRKALVLRPTDHVFVLATTVPYACFRRFEKTKPADEVWGRARRALSLQGLGAAAPCALRCHHSIVAAARLQRCAASVAVAATAAEVRIVLSHMCATAGGIERRRPQASSTSGQLEVQAAAVHDQTKRVRAAPPTLLPVYVSTLHVPPLYWLGCGGPYRVAVSCLGGRLGWCRSAGDGKLPGARPLMSSLGGSTDPGTPAPAAGMRAEQVLSPLLSLSSIALQLFLSRCRWECAHACVCRSRYTFCGSTVKT